MEKRSGVTPTKNERRSLSLAAFIISVTALISSVIAEWHLFAIVIGVIALIVALFVIFTTHRAARGRGLCFFAICMAVAAASLSAYELAKRYNAVDDPVSTVPAELRDTSPRETENALDKLKNAMDSTGKK
jgi:thiol:disulfide interchange protein